MAQPAVKMKSRDHRTRKNGHAAEQFAKLRHERNATRGKQIWVGGSIKEGGHWDRFHFATRIRYIDSVEAVS